VKDNGFQWPPPGLLGILKGYFIIKKDAVGRPQRWRVGVCSIAKHACPAASMAQRRQAWFRLPSNTVVLLVAASLLSYHTLLNNSMIHSMILQAEDRMNEKFQAKFQALLREVHELKQQLQEQHLLPPPSLALGTVLGKAMGAGKPAPPVTLALLAPLPVENWTALPVVNWTATELHFGDIFPKVLKLEPKEAIRLGKQYVAWQANLFARRGGQVWGGARSTGDKTKIERIWIWGERNSCTTIVMAILRRNFLLNCQEGMDGMNLTKCGLSECCARVSDCCSVLQLVMVA
jgi:hypothetical protein